MQSKENKKYYLKEMTPNEREQMYEDIDAERTLFHFWKKGSNSIHKLKLESRVGDILHFEKPEVMDEEFIDEFLNKIVLFKITQGESQYFTHGKLVQPDGGERLSFEINQQVYNNVQRKDCRIKSSRSVQIRFMLKDTAYDCVDVSAGGTCFIVPVEEAGQFHLEEEVKNCTLFFNKQKFIIPNCRIAANKQVEIDEDGQAIDPVHYIGVQFLDLSYKVEDEIWKLVNDEMKRVFHVESVVIDEAKKKAS
jgi:hypothetical protein